MTWHCTPPHTPYASNAVMRALQHGPRTTKQLSLLLGTTHHCMVQRLYRLKKKGLVERGTMYHNALWRLNNAS